MNLYIADTHFGHDNVIRFDGRPFADAAEMWRVMRELWNGRVRDDDDVWIIGDFVMRSDKPASFYLERLKGHKHLIMGNHDPGMLRDEKSAACFETIDKMHHIVDGKNNIIMCHFPIAEWNRMHHGSYLIYGHIHNRRDDTYDFMKTRERALNAGCMINGYMPVSFQELVENNRKFQAEE